MYAVNYIPKSITQFFFCTFTIVRHCCSFHIFFLILYNLLIDCNFRLVLFLNSSHCILKMIYYFILWMLNRILNQILISSLIQIKINSKSKWFYIELILFPGFSWTYLLFNLKKFLQLQKNLTKFCFHFVKITDVMDDNEHNLSE